MDLRQKTFCYKDGDGLMIKTVFEVPKMDCPSEERIIRLALESTTGVRDRLFDLRGRKLTVLHENSYEQILAKLSPLNFGERFLDSTEVSEPGEILLSNQGANDLEQTSILKLVFAINAFMFLVELIAGLKGESSGLVADSLDMFADATVFALSLYAVGRSIALKKQAARVSGYLQMVLAVGAVIEVVRHYIYGSEPQAPIMIVVAAVALVANVLCMKTMSKHRDGEVHMQASWIFLTNDVIANFGVILAAIVVKITGSAIPDLVAGAVIAIIVFYGSIRILRAAQ
jgi:hypothetical protein